jgi:DNA/RNA endonuclease YhcR with UshA esterase domain
MNKIFFMLALGAVAVVVPVSAHHSFAAEYDMSKPLTVTGVVTKVEWLNPHARLFIDVKDETGKVTNWEFELQAPNTLIRSGWTRTSVKPGDKVTVEGYSAKDGSNLGNAVSITLPDGRKIKGRNPDA